MREVGNVFYIFFLHFEIKWDTLNERSINMYAIKIFLKTAHPNHRLILE